MENKDEGTQTQSAGRIAANNNSRLAIMELANMISVPMSLNAVVRLNVADAMWQNGTNTPLSASEILSCILPAGTGDAENLQRILRMLSSYGVFHEHITSVDATQLRRYSLTDIGMTLVTDENGLSYGPYVLQHHQEELMKAWAVVHEAVVDSSTEPFVKANEGETAYEIYSKKPEMNDLMQKAMSGVSVPFMKAVLEDYDGFKGVERLVDVGGSAGDCLRMILEKHDNIKEGVNFDLPQVVAKAPKVDGVTHVGGDMFKSIPKGDAIFTKSVLLNDFVEPHLVNMYGNILFNKKLIPGCFGTWYEALRNYLMYTGLFNQLTRDRSVIVEDIDEVYDFDGSIRRSYEAHSHAYQILFDSIDDSYGRNSLPTTVYDLFGTILRENPVAVNNIAKGTLGEARGYLKPRGKSVSNHMKIMRSYIDELEALGHPISHQYQVLLILNSLDLHYGNFVLNYLKVCEHKSLDELETMLVSVEMNLPEKALIRRPFHGNSLCTFCKSNLHETFICLKLEDWIHENYPEWSGRMKKRNGANGKRKMIIH